MGLRCSELLGLKWEDIDDKNKTISIKRASTGVNGKIILDSPKSSSSVRTLPITKQLAQKLKNAGKDKIGFLLTTTKENLFDDTGFTKNRYKIFFNDFQTHLKDNNINIEFDYLTPHKLRHTCGTLLYAKTKDIYAVSKYLGHSNVEITAKLYVHNTVELLRNNLNIA